MEKSQKLQVKYRSTSVRNEDGSWLRLPRRYARKDLLVSCIGKDCNSLNWEYPKLKAMEIIKSDNAWDELFTGSNYLKPLEPIQVILLNQ